MSQRFLFKLIAIFVSIIGLSLVAFPFVAAFFTLKEGSVKYGYTFLDFNWKSNILVSLAIGMSTAVWNAFEFENHKNVDLRQYLKPFQRYHLKTGSPVPMDKLVEAVEQNVLNQKGWVARKWTDNGVEILRRNYLMKDVVKIHIIPEGLEISSRPRWKILLVDMARNLKNVEDVGKRLKDLR